MPSITPAPVKSLVSLGAVHALDVRVGTITRVHALERSKTLVKLVVDFGDHTRQILARLKQERADAQALEQRQALFIVNLQPKKMMGEVSQGMLFDIGHADGLTPVLAVPEQPVPNGARAG